MKKNKLLQLKQRKRICCCMSLRIDQQDVTAVTERLKEEKTNLFKWY